jgi:hypothetical protein
VALDVSAWEKACADGLPGARAKLLVALESAGKLDRALELWREWMDDDVPAEELVVYAAHARALEGAAEWYAKLMDIKDFEERRETLKKASEAEKVRLGHLLHVCAPSQRVMKLLVAK